MANLAHLIRDYQSGALSHDAFVAQLDNTLTTEGLSAARLREILDDAHARMPLPADLHAEVRRRIEQLPVSNLAGGGEETRVQTTPGQAGVDVPPAPPSSPSSPSGTFGATLAQGAASDQVKSTGDTLNNRFVLEECLGVGGMGTVYKALDLRKLEASDRKPYVAIKVLNVQFRGNPKSLIALQREARKAQVLAHRNIVTVYDFDRDGAIVYLTMEYLSGKPLSQILRTPDFHGMPVSAALPIVRGMSAALAYAHERGFVHCDFKPANVFLTEQGEVKVIDFGIARVFQRTEEENDATVFDPGSLGALTPAYASPEMLEHLEPDPRDDIYALGCITYELLTGRHPFDRLSATQARAAHRQPERPEQVSTRQWRALRAALSFDRATRMPTVARFVEEFCSDDPRAANGKASGHGAAGNGSGAFASLSGWPLKTGIAGLVVLVAAGVGVVRYRASHVEPDADRQTSAASETSAPVASEASAQPAASAVVQQPAAQNGAPASHAVTAPPPTLAMLAPLLAKVPCSALAPAIHDRAVHLRGFVGQPGDIGRLKETVAAIPGVEAVNLDVQSLGADKCEVLDAYAPYWVRNWQAGHVAALHTRAPGGQLTEGDPLVVDVSTPGYDSYVNVDYFVLDGSVVHMVPGPRAKDNQAPPHHLATVGAAGDWIVSKPFGTEMVVLLTTPAPLFDSLRPESESRADYLRALDARLRQIAAKYGQDRIAADIVPITSHARGQ
ncbi:serine/threonine protein kinase [Paraburkholderia rhizosphaerae]|uniref:Serine/threonine protein kinase n=1 Tax=Paraburkholderia rhizosphaerae TaxID=480658 RepID=A0A4R8L7L9_9BURK|nr:serine/threonine protein kinase [Paraburkholderia rhizosphaerae]TDY38736.1 serine/threonine protein kinase [Paraburkholderia rhizosphaerae]